MGQIFLLLLGMVFFLFGALRFPEPERFNFVCGGLFCWILSELITKVPLR